MARMTAPKGLRTAGRALWRSITDQYELESHETLALEQAARCADRLADLNEVVDRDGPMVDDPKRQIRIPNPALVECRQQQVVQTRLLAALRLPDQDDVRPQRRGAARGAYGPRAVADGA